MRTAPVLVALALTACGSGIEPACLEGIVVSYADADGDGYGDPASELEECGNPSEGRLLLALDCDDTDPELNPDTPEVCDGADNNCDGQADEGLPTSAYYPDTAGDFAGDPDGAIQACAPVDAYVLNSNDCDDTDLNISPNAREICDGFDNDCDGLTDNADPDVDPATFTTWYRDDDGDGYGTSQVVDQSCVGPAGTADQSGDCADNDVYRNPGATEVCGGQDEDCDGLRDDQDPSVDPATFTTWYQDADNDGFGNPLTTLDQCSQPAGYVSNGDDCDDTTPFVQDGLTTWYQDLDADGYGDPLVSVVDCLPPAGFVADATDCDDLNPLANPGQDELCLDGFDNDCNGLVDNADPGQVTPTWYPDADGDGYGDDALAVTDCVQPVGTILTGGDCDDADAAISPAEYDVCGDGIDQDCSGSDAPCQVRSCKEWQDIDPTLPDGTYTIEPELGLGLYDVWCDMTIDGGGWTLVASTRTTTLNDEASSYYNDLTTITPSNGHTGVWNGMRTVITGTSDIRFTCKTNAGDANFAVDMSFRDIHWYREITTGIDDNSCFNESNGAGYDTPAPERTNNISGNTIAQGNDWNAGFLEGEDSCSDSSDFTIDFDDRGMDSNQSDGTDWGEDDGTGKCGLSPGGDAWFILVREP